MQYRSLLILHDQNLTVKHCDIECGINIFNSASAEIIFDDLKQALEFTNQKGILCISSFEYGDIDIHGYIQSVDIKFHPTQPNRIVFNLQTELQKLSLITGPKNIGLTPLKQLLIDLLADIEIPQLQIEFRSFNDTAVSFEWYSQYETAENFFWYLIHKYRLFFLEKVEAGVRKIIFTHDILQLNVNCKNINLEYSAHQQYLFPAYTNTVIDFSDFNQNPIHNIATNCLALELLDWVKIENELVRIFRLFVHFAQASVSTNFQAHLIPQELFHHEATTRSSPQFLLANIIYNENGLVLDEIGNYTINMQFDSKQCKTAISNVAAIVPYAGKGYGWHFPYEVNTQVIVAGCNNDINKFMIIGALAYPNQDHFVTSENFYEMGFNTLSNNELRINDDVNSLTIQTQNANQIIKLDEASDCTLMLRNSKGDLQIQSSDTTLLESGELQTYKASENIKVVAQKNMQYAAEENINIYADEFSIDTKQVIMNTEKISEHYSNTVKYNSKNIKINSDEDINWVNTEFFTADANTLVIEAKHSLKLEIGGAQISLNAAGSIDIQAQSILFAGGVVATCKILGI